MINFIEPRIITPVPVMTPDYTAEDIVEDIFSLPPGSVFYFDDSLLTLNETLAMLEAVAADTQRILTLVSLQPGMILYSVHGKAAILVVNIAQQDR